MAWPLAAICLARIAPRARTIWSMNPLNSSSISLWDEAELTLVSTPTRAYALAKALERPNAEEFEAVNMVRGRDPSPLCVRLDLLSELSLAVLKRNCPVWGVKSA